MKQLEIVLNIDPLYFGDSKEQTELFAFNLNRNLEKRFNLISNYTLNFTENNYRIITKNDTQLELEVSYFIENNWHDITIN